MFEYNVVVYSSNNSGGVWWLKEEHWKRLQEAGWEVDWVDSSYTNAPASRATRTGLSYKSAIGEWEDVTGMSADVVGCPCCGPPHNFYEE